MATTTITTIEDLMRVLDENPEWLEALRTRLLTHELIELPRRMGGLDQRVGGVEERVGGLEQRSDEHTQTLAEHGQMLTDQGKAIARL